MCAFKCLNINIYNFAVDTMMVSVKPKATPKRFPVRDDDDEDDEDELVWL